MSVLSNITALKNKWNSVIKTNYQQLITGQVLNSVGHDLMDTLNSFIDAIKTTKLDKTAIGYDPVQGINLPAGATYKINGVDVLSVIISGGGSFIGDFDASAGLLPTTGSGTAGAIKKGDFWRISTGGTIIGLLPVAALTPGDVIYSKADDAAVVADFFSVEGNQDVSAILSRLTDAETKLADIEDNATADQTGAEIKALLESLVDDGLLDASAVKNIQNALYSNETYPQLDTLKKALDSALTKLASIAENANNYAHPDTHPASMISEDTTHRFVTDTEKGTWTGKATTQNITDAVTLIKGSVPEAGDNLSKLYTLIEGINTLLESDDLTLDQVQEIVDYIKDNRELIEQVTTGKVSTSDIIDNLTTNDSTKVLSAKQGKALKDLIDAIEVGGGSGEGIVFWTNLADGATITAGQSVNYSNILYFCKTTHAIGTPKTFDTTKFDREGDDKLTVPVVASEKVLTVTPAGPQTNYDVVNAPVAGTSLASADYTSGTATVTGIQGQWAYDINYYYFCVGTNTWIRLANTSSIYPLYLSRFNDSEGIATTVLLSAAYPTAQIGQRTWGTSQGLIYEKMDANTWVKQTAITI